MAKSSSAVELLRPILKLIASSKDLGMVFFIMAILAIIIVPLPSGMLDFLLTISIAISILIILISIYIPKPTDLTTFPTLILVITLFRLSLNIATTRMILSEGHNGVDEVSQIITYYPKREGMKQERKESIYFLDFMRKLLYVYREMHKLHHLIKCLYYYY